MNNIILLHPAAPEHGSSSQNRGASSSHHEITRAKDFIRQANAAFNGGNLPEARNALRSALAFNPDDAELILALGHVEFGMEQYERAARRYTMVTELNPSRTEAHSSRALSLKLLGENYEAEQSAQRALSQDKSDIVALKVLVKIRLEEGRHAEARLLCRRILDKNPSDQEGLGFLDQCRFDLEELTMETPAAPKRFNMEPAPSNPIYPATPEKLSPRLRAI